MKERVRGRKIESDGDKEKEKRFREGERDGQIRCYKSYQNILTVTIRNICHTLVIIAFKDQSKQCKLTLYIIRCISQKDNYISVLNRYQLMISEPQFISFKLFCISVSELISRSRIGTTRFSQVLDRVAIFSVKSFFHDFCIFILGSTRLLKIKTVQTPNANDITYYFQVISLIVFFFF